MQTHNRVKMFEDIFDFIRSIVKNTSMNEKRQEFFWEKMPKPDVAAILYSDPEIVWVLDGPSITTVKFENSTDSFKNEKINSFLSLNKVDMTVIAQNLVRQSISEIARTYPPISRVLLQFAIHPSKQVPTMGVAFIKEDGKFHMFYNPRFTCFFAIKSLLSKVFEDWKRTNFNLEEYFINSNLVSPIKFLLLHETMHVVKAHQSKMKGQHIVTELENIIYDSQINTQLLGMLGSEVPQNLRKEGIDEGIFISYPTSLKMIKGYLDNNVDGDPSFHPVTAIVCHKLFDFVSKLVRNGKTEKEINYVYVNFRSLFRFYTPDQVKFGMEVFESLVCSSKIIQRTIDLPDVIKRALLELQKQSEKAETFKVGDAAIFFNNLPVPVRIESISKPKKLTMAKLVDLDDGSMGDISQYFKKEVPLLFLTKPILKIHELGAIVKLFSGETVRIQNRKVSAGDLEDSDIMNIQYSTQDIFSMSVVQIKGCFVSSVVISKQNIFEGDRVLIVATGQEGIVIGVKFTINVYEINVSVSGLMIVEKKGIQEIKKITEKIKMFAVNDYVYIDKEKKAGRVIGVPVEPNGLYKVQIIPDEVWQALVKSGKESNDVVHDEDEGLMIQDYYAGELTFLPLQAKQPSEGEGESGEGEGESGEGESGEGEGLSGGESGEGGESSGGQGGKPSGGKGTSEGKDPDTEAVENAQEKAESTDQKEPQNSPEHKNANEESDNKSASEGNSEKEDIEEKFGEDDKEGGGSEADEPDISEESEGGEGKASSDPEEGEGHGKGTSARDLNALAKELQSLLEDGLEEAIKQEIINEEEQKEVQKDMNSDIPKEGSNQVLQPDILGNIDIPQDVSESIDRSVRAQEVEVIPWKVVLARRITDITGIRVYNDDQIPSRRIVGVFEEEEEIPHFRSIGIMFDTSGSMSIMQSMKSLRIIQDFFKDSIFKECTIWVGHYASDLHHTGKLRQFQRERFMTMCKEGFSASGGTDFEPSLKKFIQMTRPLPDFILHFTDGQYSLNQYKNDAKLRKAEMRTITCIVGETTYKNNEAYREADSRMKKNFILGAKSS